MTPKEMAYMPGITQGCQLLRMIAWREKSKCVFCFRQIAPDSCSSLFVMRETSPSCFTSFHLFMGEMFNFVKWEHGVGDFIFA